MDEQWTAVPGYEGWYEVSDRGRHRRIRPPRRGHSKLFTQQYPVVLTPLVYRKGYLKAHFGTCDGTKPVTRQFIHRVVWEAFCGPIPDGVTVNHIDGNPANNVLANLELATPLEQVHHARNIGLQRWRTEDGYSYPILTATTVKQIRKTYASGDATYQELADRYGVSKGTIGHILHRRTWAHV